MSTTSQASGILPDAVIKDRNANAYLLAVVLEPGMDAAGVQAWLTQVTNLLGVLQQRDPEGTRVATAHPSAFSQTFFTASGQPRFGLSAAQIPAELAAPSSLRRWPAWRPWPGTCSSTS